MLTLSARWSIIAEVSNLCLYFTEILRSIAVVCTLAAHYIPEKDVFLIATGIAHPARESGISIWQTIGNIDEDKPLQSTVSTVTHESSRGWLSLLRYVVIVFGLIVVLLSTLKPFL